MVTMATRGGADRQVLSKVTHNATGEMIDRYTHHEWEPLCNAVLAIGSVFDARPSARGNGGIPQKTGGESDGNKPRMLAESHEAGTEAPSSIPRASTVTEAKKGSKKEA